MRKYLFLFSLLISGFINLLSAQTVIADTLLFTFSLHGQTRVYQVLFENRSNSLSLQWGIERNTQWQSGSYEMELGAIQNADRLSFLQPQNGQHVQLSPRETFALISRSAYKQLKENGKLLYNETHYHQSDANDKALGYSLLHVVDSIDGCEMWILDNPDFPLVWRMRNNPLGINWEVRTKHVRMSAQSLQEELEQQPEKTGSVYYAYPRPMEKQTPVPDGYAPFYVSHYGRHGSRWLTSDERYKRVLDVFQTHELTSLGRDVLKRLQQVWEDACGRGGDLTSVGERQQKEIAERLYDNYPDVFRNNVVVSARSSIALRCVMSMSAFCERLKELNPNLKVVREANRRYMDYIAYTSPEGEVFCSEDAEWRKEFHAFEKTHIKPERLMTALFVYPEQIENSYELMMGLYWIASDMQNVELSLSFYDIFEKEELLGIWQSVNYRMYVCNAVAPVNKGIMPRCAVTLLRNIIDNADQAIKQQIPCATFRFGHDTNLIRLLALMQLEDCCNQETNPNLYYLAWQDFKVSPMAANLQIVFFKNGEGNVIVKFLHNENEVKLPINSHISPYYEWEKVKAFYASVLAF